MTSRKNIFLPYALLFNSDPISMLKYSCKDSERPDILADLQENIGLLNIHGFFMRNTKFLGQRKKHHMTKQNEQHTFFSFPWHQIQKGSHRWDETDVCLCRGLYPIPYRVCASHTNTHKHICVYIKYNIFIPDDCFHLLHRFHFFYPFNRALDEYFP